MKTVQAVLGLSAEYLSKVCVGQARRCAEELLAHSLKIARLDLYMQWDRPLEEEELASYRASLKRLGYGEPLEHILGEVTFYGARIAIGKEALIPRPETEILLDMACRSVTEKTLTALDLCTGSGCLALGLKKAHPHLEVTATDLSESALNLAQTNGQLNQLDIQWLHGNMLEPVAGHRFDLILCNPPYISEKEYASLAPNVRDYEPKMALTPGETGLEFFEYLALTLPDVLHPGAKIFLEIGMGQGELFSAYFLLIVGFTHTSNPTGLAMIDFFRLFLLKINDFSPIISN